MDNSETTPTSIPTNLATAPTIESSPKFTLVKDGKGKWHKHKGKRHHRQIRKHRFWSGPTAPIRVWVGPESQPPNERSGYQTAIPAPEISSPLPAPSEAWPEKLSPQKSPARISCDQASNVIANYGFVDIEPTACTGKLYEFTATRDGTSFTIALNSADGELAQVRKIQTLIEAEKPWD